MHLNCTGSYKNPRYLYLYCSGVMRIICPECKKVADRPASREGTILWPTSRPYILSKQAKSDTINTKRDKCLGACDDGNTDSSNHTYYKCIINSSGMLMKGQPQAVTLTNCIVFLYVQCSDPYNREYQCHDRFTRAKGWIRPLQCNPLFPIASGSY